MDVAEEATSNLPITCLSSTPAKANLCYTNRGERNRLLMLAILLSRDYQHLSGTSRRHVALQERSHTLFSGRPPHAPVAAERATPQST